MDAAADLLSWIDRAEVRLRAGGLSGHRAFVALCRHLARAFELPPGLWLEGPDVPERIELDPVPVTSELDLFGLAYERFFSDVFKAERGQFFTPKPLVELMADLAVIGPEDRVLDPTCGSGTFLVVAHQRGGNVCGVEIDPELVGLCRLNLKMHGVRPQAVRQADFFLEDDEGKWDVILANPPFSVEINDPLILRRHALSQGKSKMSSDHLFLEAAWRSLKPGGRLVAVLPHSILSNARHAQLRDWILDHYQRRAVISLPEGVFRPFGGTAARACIVSLEKRPVSSRSWVAAVVTNPGYDTSRRIFRRSDPDELSSLRASFAAGTLPLLPVDLDTWQPEVLWINNGIGPTVPRAVMKTLATGINERFRPSRQPRVAFTEIDLADIDKRTGEIRCARIKKGSGFSGEKVSFKEGDVLFSRMRPNLNNVALAVRPDSGLPSKMCGSAEWVPLRPGRLPGFVLTAARSSFVRAQLLPTSGQTRPRVCMDDVTSVVVPDPGEDAKKLMDAIVVHAHEQRRIERQRIAAVDVAYEQFGRGEIDAAALVSLLRGLLPEG